MTIKLRIYQTDLTGTHFRQPQTFETEPGRLTDLLEQQQIHLPNSCGGLGRCGKCRVMILKKSSPDYKLWRNRKKPAYQEVCGAIPSSPACQIFLHESALIFLHKPGEIATASSRPIITSAAQRQFALAVDLGSTNIDGLLLDLESGTVSAPCSVRNPQTEYGADIVSRLSTVVSRKFSADDCRRKTHEAIRELVHTLAYHESVPETAVTASVRKAVVAGNSVVTYLFLGIDPHTMTVPPYEPAALDFASRPASSCGFPLAEKGKMIPVPLLGGLVGGDLVAGIFALETNPEYGFTFGQAGPELLLDVGTNSEMLLFKDGKIYVSQAAAGPVFEGDTLSCGSCAKPNAIGHLRITGDGPLSSLPPSQIPMRMEYETFAPSDQLPCGLAGSAVIDITAELLRTGDLDSSGKLKREIPITPDLRLTQKDVRQIQLALGAIRAGMAVLFEAAGTTWQDLKTLYLAGGLGNGIDFEKAQRVGLFPKEFDSARFIPCGNTSLQGALAVLRNEELLKSVRTLREKTQLVPLGGNPRFRDEFLRAMALPKSKG